MKTTGRVQLLTIPEAAERLRCSVRHVYRMLETGVLTPVDIGLPGAERAKTRVREGEIAGLVDGRARKAG